NFFTCKWFRSLFKISFFTILFQLVLICHIDILLKVSNAHVHKIPQNSKNFGACKNSLNFYGCGITFRKHQKP
ncbi:MAG: hypothetical protein ABFC34_06895, partial [Methanobacterium sp.]